MAKHTSVIMGGMAAALAFAATAGAAPTTTPLYAGGSTLVEKAYRDLFDTYGKTSSSDLCSGRTLCPTTPYNSAAEILYVGVGSGNGLKALDAHDSSLYVTGSKTPDAIPTPSGRDFGAFYGTGTGASWVPGTGVGPFYPSVTFSGSDNTLGSTDESSVVALGYGEPVQIPGLVAAIAVPFHPTANWTPSGATLKGASSKVQLSTNTLCGIYTGKITDWSAAPITKDNGGIQLGKGKITVVYRSDSSGTTFIFTNALLNQCGTPDHRTVSPYPVPTQWLTDNSLTANASVPFYKSGTSFFINVFNAGHLPKNFYVDPVLKTGGASGSGGIKAAILATVGSIGYVSPDFVLPIDSTGPEAANLQTFYTFSRKQTPVYLAPTAANATVTMSSTLPPSFAGSPAPAAEPLNWGAVVPRPANQAAYPISGFSFIDLYSCYSSAATVSALVGPASGTAKAGYLTWYYGSSSVNGGEPASVLAADGFAPVPPAWSTAINKLLTSATLGISTPGTKACKGISKGA